MDLYDPVPYYRQIADKLRAQIDSGTLRPGARVPSEVELSQAYGVARGTARAALDLLAEEGLIIRLRGRGSYVKP